MPSSPASVRGMIRKPLGLAATAAAVVLGLAACAGGSSGTGATAPQPGGTSSAAFDAAHEGGTCTCLRSRPAARWILR